MLEERPASAVSSQTNPRSCKRGTACRPAGPPSSRFSRAPARARASLGRISFATSGMGRAMCRPPWTGSPGRSWIPSSAISPVRPERSGSAVESNPEEPIQDHRHGLPEPVRKSALLNRSTLFGIESRVATTQNVETPNLTRHEHRSYRRDRIGRMSVETASARCRKVLAVASPPRIRAPVGDPLRIRGPERGLSLALILGSLSMPAIKRGFRFISSRSKGNFCRRVAYGVLTPFRRITSLVLGMRPRGFWETSLQGVSLRRSERT